LDQLAIYIHWPYCARICPYCDFNVYKGRRNDDLVQAIRSDLQYWRNETGPKEIRSVHFGGGTPSLLGASDLHAILDIIDHLWGCPDAAEIGLEANPIDFDDHQWRDIHKAGINRLSLGVQSFDDDVLRFLGRAHDSTMAKRAASGASEIFPNLSMDLIFGWAGQEQTDWHDDLHMALSFNPQHLSTYQLTIEEGTAFARAENRGETRAVNSDESADLYDMAHDLLLGAGFNHYEVSNYALPGFESRHNLTYWQGLDYLGVGPGAHGRLNKVDRRYATIALAHPEKYIRQIKDTGHGIETMEPLSPMANAEEYLFMGLRSSAGISLDRFRTLAGITLPKQTLLDLQAQGLLNVDGDRLVTRYEGRRLLDGIIDKLLV